MNKHPHPMSSRWPLLNTLGFILMAGLIPLAGYSQALAASAMKTGNPFSPEVITTLMRKVNNYQVGHPVMKGSNHNWERGTWYTGSWRRGEPAKTDERCVPGGEIVTLLAARPTPCHLAPDSTAVRAKPKHTLAGWNSFLHKEGEPEEDLHYV
jgi:hypothetical protein